MTIEPPIDAIDRYSVGYLDSYDLGENEIIFEVYPCIRSQVEYIEEQLKLSLKHQYRSEDSELPLRVAALDDVERSLIDNAIDSMLRYKDDSPPARDEQYECQMVVERWMGVQFSTLLTYLPDNIWIRKRQFGEYIQILEEYDASTVLSSIIGAVPRIVKLEAAVPLDIKDDSIPDSAEYLLVRPRV